MRAIWVITVSMAFAAAGCGKAKDKPAEPPKVDKDTVEAAAEQEETKKEDEVDPVKAALEKFAPTKIGVPEEKIPEDLRPVIKKLVEAAQIMDKLFLHQVAGENEKWRAEMAKEEGGEDLVALFNIMYGPWDRTEEHKAFWGDKEKPAGATYYPEDMTKEELEKWIEAHPDQKEAFTGYFSVITRDGEDLKAIPYNEAYKEYLEPAAKLLNEAAELSKDKRLKKFLKARAEAFSTNEYRESDMAWMDLGDGAIEVVIGPYEVYEDALMGYKAAFESFVTLRDPEDSKELARIKELIPEMEKYLPIPDEHKNLDRGSESPISVVDVLYTGGDTRAGVQTLAFNLPNDEVVREKKGSKKVMLKNVAHAKFDQILMPIARRLLAEDQIDDVSFDAFFNHTLVHETAHGLGPGKITVEKDGKKVETTVNEELKELYAVIEEAKADTLGMYLNYLLIDKGMHDKAFEKNMYASFLGGFFRSVRFGAEEAHGKANVIQFNYLMDKGAIKRNEDGRYAYVADKMKDAVKSLAHDVLMLEATGDYEGSKAFIEKYGEMPEDLETALASLSDIPTDIRPIYPIEEQMKDW